ncbi:putative signal peptide protein [Puccinia sorghi]|uniref:Putative signal peptide protein n=1 Tax=Puccinia sorghi TaxID=27349 RepID=A0A0L6VE58_9BASI|nr:putative signal peptide protein [Puccinia sorghi]
MFSPTSPSFSAWLVIVLLSCTHTFTHMTNAFTLALLSAVGAHGSLFRWHKLICSSFPDVAAFVTSLFHAERYWTRRPPPMGVVGRTIPSCPAGVVVLETFIGPVTIHKSWLKIPCQKIKLCLYVQFHESQNPRTLGAFLRCQSVFLSPNFQVDSTCAIEEREAVISKSFMTCQKIGSCTTFPKLILEGYIAQGLKICKHSAYETLAEITLCHLPLWINSTPSNQKLDIQVILREGHAWDNRKYIGEAAGKHLVRLTQPEVGACSNYFIRNKGRLKWGSLSDLTKIPGGVGYLLSAVYFTILTSNNATMVSSCIIVHLIYFNSFYNRMNWDELPFTCKSVGIPYSKSYRTFVTYNTSQLLSSQVLDYYCLIITRAVSLALASKCFHITFLNNLQVELRMKLVTSL